MRRLEERLVADVRRLRQQDPRGALLLVVPSRLLGAWLRARLARALDGVAGIHVVTLPELAERVALLPLARAGRQPLPAVADRLLVDRAIREAVPPAGGYFSGVIDARNFPAAVLRTLLDVKRAGLGPAELAAAFPESAKLRELAASYQALETAIARHGYYDASDLLAEAARLVVADPGRLGAAAVLAFGFVEVNPLEARLLDACGRAAPVLRYVAGADAADLPAPAGHRDRRGARRGARGPRDRPRDPRPRRGRGQAGRGRHPAPPAGGVPGRGARRLRRGRHPVHPGDGAGRRRDPGRPEPASPGRGAAVGFRPGGGDGVPGVRRSPAPARNESRGVGAAVAPGRDRRRRSRVAGAPRPPGPPARAGGRCRRRR